MPALGIEPPASDKFSRGPAPRAVTSHTLSLSTGSVRLDLTWRREEHDQPPAVARKAPAKTAAVPAPRPAAPRPWQTFAEVLRRRQLAGLLLMPSRPPADRQPLPKAMDPAPALPGPVCRAYAEAEAAPLGPLAAEGCRRYSA